MNEAVVAKRYADALFQLASENNKVDKLISELQLVKTVFKDDKNIINFLNHPRVKNEDKMKLIDEAFKQNDKDVVNTLKILVERHRIDTITSIVHAFVEQYNEANGIAAADVYSVRALSEEEQTNIEASLKKQLDKKSVLINNIVDPSVLGGLRIRVGNTIYDGSISGKLYRIKQTFASSTI
ncbi:F0F1 ATP synthase subunit delta [Pseudogracilibacillus sp. SO30301A]|uniref:F0F1 ATP synthase subunit delta n=1 Tax=Pseudogracilibacillus sp. SO30301A TaxID=3098291 RepID=UPI00300E3442